jgi:tetratricopeptide (TPR) repeat protein
MATIKILTKLREKLPAQEARWVSTSLNADPLVWASLQSIEWSENGIELEPGNYRKWSPAHLALKALGSSISADELTEDLGKSPEIALLQSSAKYFQDTRRLQRPPKTIAEAGLLAISLRQHWRLDSTWKGLLNQLTSSGGEPDSSCIAIWQSAIACLFGLVPDPVEMLRGLFSKRMSPVNFSLVTHAIICNPLSENDQLQLFYSLIFSLPPIQQVAWLRFLKFKGKDELVEELARMILSKIPASNASALVEFNPDDWDLENLLVKSLELQRMAGLYRYANQPANARTMLEKAQKAFNYWSAGLNLQQADLAYLSDQWAAAEQYIVNSLPSVDTSANLQQEMMMVVGGPQSEQLLARLPQSGFQPVAEIFRAGIFAREHKITHAIAIAREAVERWMDNAASKPEIDLPNFAFEWQVRPTIQILLDLGLIQEALQIIKWLLTVQPSNQELLELASMVSEQQGQVDEALHFCEVLTTLDTDDTEKHRHLAYLLGKKEDWPEALAERQLILKIANPPDVEDWNGHALAACHLDQWDEVVNSAEQALQLKPDNGLAYALLGQAKVLRSDFDEAEKFLNQATLLSPDEALGWLYLAEFYEKKNDTQKSLETLRAAVLALPESADINFKLARICLRQGLLSDGLPFLRKAATLSPESLDVSFELGQTLYSLGRLDEAYRVLGLAFEKWPHDPDLAYAYAQAAITSGDRDGALEALKCALEKEEPDPEWYILYAETLVGIDPCTMPVPEKRRPQLEAAERALDMALKKIPDHLAARTLKAEVLCEKGEYEKAHEIYRQLLETPEANSPSVRWRMQAGVGKVLLEMGQIESALASLQEAAQNQSENVGLQQMLAKAFQAGDLISEALATARNALKLAPDDLDNLSWFAETMVDLGEPVEAVHALRVATELDPACPANWIRLADLLFRIGDLKSSSESLEKLLEISPLDENTLRQAATIYYKNGAMDQAIHCIERAASEVEAPSKMVLTELAYLQWVSHNYASGQSSIERAIDADPDDGYLYVVQADMLARQEKFDAAIACLEHELILSVPGHSPNDNFWSELATSDFVDMDWIRGVCDQAQIHARFALLYRRAGNLPAALQHAELAFELKPNAPTFALMAVDWTLASNLSDQAARIGNEFNFDAIDRDLMKEDVRIALASLAAVNASLLLQKEEIDQAQEWIEKGFEIQAQASRLEAAYSYLLVRQGNWIKADEAYKKILGKGNDEPLAVQYDYPFPSYWIGLTALETQHWSDALQLFREAVKNYPNEPMAQLGLARTLIEAAETQRLYAEVQCLHSLPAEDCLSDERSAEFELAIQNVIRLDNSSETRTWEMRGRAAFSPTTQNLRGLSNLLPEPAVAEVLVASLRRAENLAGAMQVGEQFPEHYGVQCQVALTHLSIESEKGLNLARLVVEKQPSNVMGWITLSLIAKKLNETEDAYMAIKRALSFWPDEPIWQSWAAELAALLDDREECVNHWEYAVALSPQHFPYIMALGGAYLRSGQSYQAVTALEKASQINPERSDVWFMLAQAYRHTRQLNMALQCADKAINLEPDSAQPLLLSGEIYLDMNEKDAALKCAQRAFNRDQQNEVSLLFYVKVLKSLGKPDEALAILEHARETLASQRVEVERVRLIIQQRGPLVALPLLQQLVSTYPEDVEVLAMQGSAQYDSNDFPAAVKTVGEGLKVQPSHAELNFLMGKLQHGEGQLDNAVYFFSTAIKNDPTCLDAYLELAKTYQERREIKEALETYQTATKVAPKDFRPYYNAALMLRDSKDYLSAEAMLRKAAELAPDDVNIRRQLGAVITLNLIHNSQEASTTHETYWSQDSR